MGNVTLDDARKTQFKRWLVEEKTFSQNKVDKSIDLIMKMFSFKNNFSIFEIDEVDYLKRHKESIMKTENYKRLPEKDQFVCNKSFELYIEFLQQRIHKQYGYIITEVDDVQADGVVSAWDQFQEYYSELQTGLSTPVIEHAYNSIMYNSNSPITAILHDSQYQPLIETLQQDGITTLGQLLDINLVAYINSKNLYSWEKRLIIWEGLNVLLEPYGSNFKYNAISPTLNAEFLNADEPKHVVNADGGLHQVDINNIQSYPFMKPRKFILQGKEFAVNCWRDVLIGVCEELFENFPSQMASLIDQPVGREARPIFGRNKSEFLHFNILSNGLYIDVNLSAYGVLNKVRAVCQKCSINPEELEIFVESPKAFGENCQMRAKVAKQYSASEEEKSTKTTASAHLVDTIKRFIKKCGLSGCSTRNIQSHTHFKSQTVVNILAEDNNIVEIGKDRYIHRDNIVDIDEAANIIKCILTAQFEQFHGYSSIQLLYDAVCIDLSLFLNDNNFNNIYTVYYLAKHLFSKEKYAGEKYIFFGNKHIWRQEPDYPKTLKGLLMHYARMAENTISLEECETILKKLGFSYSSTKQLMQITLEPTFLQYDKDKFLLNETLCINKHWIGIVKKSLVELFDDNDYVILRDIRSEWYSTLPLLPFGLPWTRLLLQEILGYYPEIGYRTIAALAGQTTGTIHAAIVSRNSPIETFADLISTFFYQEKMNSRKLAAEELRLLLRQHGILEGNELYGNMHKALDDYRFAWDNQNKTVLINVGW